MMSVCAAELCWSSMDLYERLSAAENLDYYGRIWHMSKADREKRIRELLEPLDLYRTTRRTYWTLEPRHEAKTGRGADAHASPGTGFPR